MEVNSQWTMSRIVHRFFSRQKVEVEALQGVSVEAVFLSIWHLNEEN